MFIYLYECVAVGLIFMDMLMYVHIYVSVRMLLCVEDVYIHTYISVLQLCRSTRLFVSYTLLNSLPCRP